MTAIQELQSQIGAVLPILDNERLLRQIVELIRRETTTIPKAVSPPQSPKPVEPPSWEVARLNLKPPTTIEAIIAEQKPEPFDLAEYATLFPPDEEPPIYSIEEEIAMLK